MDISGRELLDQARDAFAKFLPDYIELQEPTYGDTTAGDRGNEAVWELRAQNSGYGQVLVMAKNPFAPRDAERILAGLTPAVRQLMGHQPTILVVAPWLSPRSREVLHEKGFCYLDLTGNVFFRAERPAIFVQVQGSERDPNPPKTRQVGVQGPKARRLVRLLVDYLPPLRLTDLAAAGGLNPGYVSRLLDALNDQALVERGRRGLVEQVAWRPLLEVVASSYALMKGNPGRTFVAPGGAAAMLRRLGEGGAPDVVVTGSFAAAAVEPVAAPSQLVLSAADPEAVRQFGALLPTDRGADVMVLRPTDPTPLDRARLVDGVRHVALSQLVLDCLNGPGRLPQEGRAVLDWMTRHESAWRTRTLSAGPE